MKALLTSSGVTNASLRDALVELLGKPIEESSALFVPTAIYPFPGGAKMAWQAMGGQSASSLCGLGWKSLGILELSVLPSIAESAWAPSVAKADALLVWGGDPMFLAQWMRRSGLATMLPTLSAVYVGVSAGAMVASSIFAETYHEPPAYDSAALTSEEVVFDTPDGDLDRLLVTAAGVGLVNFAVIAHLDNPSHPDASSTNAQRWAERIPAPTYAIDDQSAIRVVDGEVQVVSEGHWELFQP